MSTALAALAVGGGLISGSYSWWQGAGVLNAIVIAAGVLGVLLAVSIVVVFVQAARRRVLRPGWWLSIVPVLMLGLLAGLIVAPFTALDIEAGVFMTLLVGPLVAGVVLWIALWTLFLAVRSSRRQPA